MNGGNFESVARNWDRLSFTFSDTLASLMVELTPLFEKLLAIVNGFISSGGVKKTINTIKDFFSTISNSKLVNNFLSAFEKMKPFFVWFGEILAYIGGLAIDGLAGAFDLFGKIIDKVKFLFKAFPLYFENFLLSIQEGLKKMQLYSFEFLDSLPMVDMSKEIKAVEKEISEINRQKSTNDNAINQFSQNITIENKIVSSDINQQVKNTTKAFK